MPIASPIAFDNGAVVFRGVNVPTDSAIGSGVRGTLIEIELSSRCRASVSPSRCSP
ncbi:MAG: hypothetical protein ABIO85_09130 [Sphingomicrobium sp.]